ncbi:MAG: hypothetical protein JF607_23965 [Burkholderiales bacterium]|nr:hypothetical protein [Burkholderiales bacterium]
MTELPAGESCLDLLSQPLLAVEGPSALNLPQVLAALSRGENLVFTHLRPHQQAPWHAFLVQLAYLALEKAAQAEAPQEETDWAGMLLALSDGQPSAWQLCVDDWQRPAFLQPPCGSGRETDFSDEKIRHSAQSLDLLVASKNFDEKSHKLSGFEKDQLDCWIYALVSLQGFAMWGGPTYYNSMRMNSSSASRSQFRLVFERGSGAEFLRDLQILIDRSVDFWSQEEGIGSGRRLPLLWLEKWDDDQLPLADVHPLCIEASRRVRLRREHGFLVMRRAGSKGMRVAANSQHGVVLDPWIPLTLGKDGVKAATLQADGLSYRQLAKTVLDRKECTLPLLARPSDAERRAGLSATLVAQVLVGGQSKTDGLRRRELLFPMPVLRALADGDERLAQRSNAFVLLAKQASTDVLRPALIQFIDGSEKVNLKHADHARMATPWMERLEAEIDSRFFTTLFDSVTSELSDKAAHDVWEDVEQRLHSDWLKQFGQPLRAGAAVKDTAEDTIT